MRPALPTPNIHKAAFNIIPCCRRGLRGLPGKRQGWDIRQPWARNDGSAAHLVLPHKSLALCLSPWGPSTGSIGPSHSPNSWASREYLAPRLTQCHFCPSPSRACMHSPALRPTSSHRHEPRQSLVAQVRPELSISRNSAALLETVATWGHDATPWSLLVPFPRCPR